MGGGPMKNELADPQRRKYPGFLEDSGGSALAGAVAAAVLGSAR